MYNKNYPGNYYIESLALSDPIPSVQTFGAMQNRLRRRAMPEVDQSSCLLEADLEPGPILSSL